MNNKAANTQTNFNVKNQNYQEERSPQKKINSLVGGGTGARAATAMGTTTMNQTASATFSQVLMETNLQETQRKRPSAYEPLNAVSVLLLIKPFIGR